MTSYESPWDCPECGNHNDGRLRCGSCRYQRSLVRETVSVGAASPARTAPVETSWQPTPTTPSDTWAASASESPPPVRPARGIGIVVVVVVALVALAFAGFQMLGDDEATERVSTATIAPTPTTAAITKSAYVTRANTICAEMNRQNAAIPDPGRDAVRVADALEYSRAIVIDTVERLRALPVPPGEEQKLAYLYAGVDSLTNRVAEVSQAIRYGDRADGMAAADALEQNGNAVNAAFINYGMTVCGS